MDCSFLRRLILLLATASVVVEGAKFLASPVPSQVNEGQSVTLSCQIDSPVVHCDWQRQQQQEVATSCNSTSYDVIGNRTRGECHLVVVRANPERDEGKWRCSLHTQDDQVVVSDFVSLAVLRKNSPSSSSLSDHQLQSPSDGIRPGVLVGGICGAICFLGGLVTFYCYKRKQPCFLAPSGYASRSMLIVSANSTPENPRAADYKDEPTPPIYYVE